MSSTAKSHDATNHSSTSYIHVKKQQHNNEQDHHSPFFSNGKKGLFFQPKLIVNKVNDPYEVEADKVAEEVTQSIYNAEGDFFPPTPPPKSDSSSDVQRTAFFQRKSAFEQEQPTDSETEVQRKSRNGNAFEHISRLNAVSNSENSAAQRLPAFESPSEMDLNSAADPDIQRSADSNSSISQSPPDPSIQHRDDEISSSEDGLLQRREGLATFGEDQNASPEFESRLHSSKGGGNPLESKTKDQMESAFGADFSSVRIHTDGNAKTMNNQVFAHAFTHGSDIYFNQGSYQPDKKEGANLLAHELTHVVQQGGASKSTVQRSPKASVNVTQTAPPMVQRGIISKARNWAAGKAANIPGYTMLTVILGFNPINGANVTRNATNIFRGIMGFIPGGDLIWQALNNHGIFDKVGSWLVQKFEELKDIGSSIKDAFWEFLDSLGWRDIFQLGSLWSRAKRIFTAPIKKIISFAVGLVKDILIFIRDAILKPLAVLAEGTRAWDLLIAVLGVNPITGESVPRTADTLIGGFMKLIGQEEIWENMKKANAVARGWAWFQSTISQLIAMVSALPGKFIKTLKSLTITDLVLVPRAFAKIVGVFANFAMDFISWAGNAVWELLMIIFEVVAPGAVPFLKRAGAAFKSILKNPIGFLGNLVQAGKMGFNMFKENIGSILKEVLIDWLTGTLEGAGIYIPQALEFSEIVKFVLSVLGLTWENIRAKLVEHLGEGPVVVLEEGFELVQTLVTEGPGAAWEQIKEHLSNLQETIVGEIISWVTQTVVAKAVTKIITSLNPVGGFVQAILTIWGVIKVFIQRIRKIIEVGMAFLNSIVEIAEGNLMPAAQKIVTTMKGILVLAVSFLAEFAGLGKIGKALQNILKKIRDPIDKAMDKVIGWIAGKAKGFLKKKDNAEHKKIASAAVKDIKEGAGQSKTYEELRVATATKVKAVEQRYQGQLKDGVKIKVHLIPAAEDKEDQDLDFKVVVAPNDEVQADSIPTPDAVEGLPEWMKDGVTATVSYSETRKYKGTIAIDKSDKMVKVLDTKPTRRGSRSVGNILIPFDKVKTTNIFQSDPPDHDEYIPISVVPRPKGGNTEVDITVKNGTKFKAVVGSDGLVTNIQGFSLQLKKEGMGRGVTERSGGYTSGMDMNASHLIADEFGGSGYASSLNLVTASDKYNTQVMRGAERQIKDFIIANQAVEFDLSVSVAWGEIAGDKAVEAIMMRYLAENPDMAQPDKAKVQQEVLSKLSSTSDNLKRVMGVEYTVTVKKSSGGKAGPRTFTIGPDTYLGA